MPCLLCCKVMFANVILITWHCVHSNGASIQPSFGKCCGQYKLFSSSHNLHSVWRLEKNEEPWTKGINGVYSTAPFYKVTMTQFLWDCMLQWSGNGSFQPLHYTSSCYWMDGIWILHEWSHLCDSVVCVNCPEHHSTSWQQSQIAHCT